MRWNPLRWFERRSSVTDAWTAGEVPTQGTVSQESALRLGAVFAAGRLLASNVAALPIQTYRRTGEARERVALPSLLVSPSVQGTRRDWIFRAMTSLIYRGNAVGLIVSRNSEDFATGLEWLNPDEVSVEDSQPYGPGSFRQPIWRWRGQVVSQEDLVHIPWFTLPNRVWGLSPIAAYASAVSTGLAAQDFSREWFDSGGVPPGTFANATQTVSQAEAEVIGKRVTAAIRKRRPIVYGKDWTYTPISISPNEAKFVETMRLTASQIAHIYGIPPEMIGGETGKSETYANVEQQSIEFVQYTLLPWLTTLESHLSELLPRGQYVKFNVDALTRPDAETRYANYEKARLIGLLSIDEIRAMEDLPPLPNGQGADHTPLPLAAGATVGVPSIRGELGRPRLVDREDRDHG